MKSFTIVLGTAIRWVSRYSESWMMREGSTTVVRDLLERLPLVTVRLNSSNNGKATLRLLSLEDCEGGLDLVVLIVFILNVVIYTGDFLRIVTSANCTSNLVNPRSQTFCSISMSSPRGLSALYLTLFQWKALRY